MIFFVQGGWQGIDDAVSDNDARARQKFSLQQDSHVASLHIPRRSPAACSDDAPAAPLRANIAEGGDTDREAYHSAVASSRRLQMSSLGVSRSRQVAYLPQSRRVASRPPTGHASMPASLIFRLQEAMPRRPMACHDDINLITLLPGGAVMAVGISLMITEITGHKPSAAAVRPSSSCRRHRACLGIHAAGLLLIG